MNGRQEFESERSLETLHEAGDTLEAFSSDRMPLKELLGIIECPHQDSNLGPADYESAALTN